MESAGAATEQLKFFFREEQVQLHGEEAHKRMQGHEVFRVVRVVGFLLPRIDLEVVLADELDDCDDLGLSSNRVGMQDHNVRPLQFDVHGFLVDFPELGVVRAEAHLGNLYTESGQTLKGSFSAVSKPIFATKYSLESSRRDLHNALLCTVLESGVEKSPFSNLKCFVTNC